MSSERRRAGHPPAADGPPGGRVLVVDDDPHSVDILTRLLTAERFNVVGASSGSECLRIVRAQPIDVILLDVMMPEMDGLQVCAELRRREESREIPIILLTAKDDIETRAAGMKLGVSEFLTKPVNKADLFSRVRAQLHARQLERDLERTRRALAAATTEGR